MNNINNEYDVKLEESAINFGRNLVYLLMSLPFGIFYFTFAVTGISLGFGLSIIYIGIPVLAGTLICARKIVAYEKYISAKNLNTSISSRIDNPIRNEGQGVIKQMLGVIKDPQNRKNIIYCMIKLPISIIHFAVATCLSALSLGLICTPIVFVVSRRFGIDMFSGNNITIGDLLGLQLPNSVEIWLYTVLGLVIGYFSVKMINALAEKSYKFTLRF